MYTHAQRHMYTHTYRHMYTHTYTYTHRYMYIHRNTCTYIHRHMYTQTYVHTHTHICTCTHTQTHVHTDTCTHTRIHIYMHTQTHTNTHTCTRTHTHTHIKSYNTLLFTHRAWYCTLGGGREHSTHSFLCFHCAQLLISLTAPSANDRSGLSSEPAQLDGPGGHTRPHHNFHLPLAIRREEISS
ncbi:unnamed protein product, partial [Staurois parvus]